MLGLLWLACDGTTDRVDQGPDGDDDDDTTVVTDTTDTGGGTLPPATVSATCEPTDNPLRFVCAVTVDPPLPVQVTYARADGTGRARTHTSDATAGAHDVPIWFLEPGADYAFTASPVGRPEATAAGTFTAGVPAQPLEPLEITGATDVPYVGTHFPCGQVAMAVVYDTASGEPVWYHVLDPLGTLGFLNMVRFTEDHTILGDTDGQVVEVDLMGNDLLRLVLGTDYDYDLHHDLFKRDGLYYLLYHVGKDPLLDGFSMLDGTGTVVAAWDPFVHLPIPKGTTGYFTHTNTVFVDESGDVLLSMFAQDTIVKVEGDPASPDFGTILWALAGDDQGAFGQDFAIDWSGVPSPEGFGNQHDVAIAPDGRLVFLDNLHARGLALTVDEAQRTATVDDAWPTNAPCTAQGTTALARSGEAFASCNGPSLYAWEPGAADPTWEARAVCPSGPEANVARWYPLEGW